MSAVLITSASRGIGLEFVRQYAEDGWRVFAACRDPATAAKLEPIARAAKGSVEVLKMDVTDAEGVRRAAKQLGEQPIDVLVNSAGIMGGGGQRLGDMDYAAWSEVLDVNTLGPMRVTEAFIDHVRRSPRKTVVTITSGMGSLADNTSGGWIAYRSSKAAVNMVMRSLALDLKSRGIICVVLNPGWVKTDMGGPNANITPQKSVSNMRRVIDKLSAADSGKFLHHDGSEYPW
ncbi:MAG TPA: SDR family oxidoreductase [Steroidobacteraceae bacterium]|jgi:NAD(P)-dependent dehydrogenase (short-subunit alcohol dehydrogenase family)|nr:SDR family oxidoreductase [Steroidobacteraceae bacterium]